MRKYKNRPAEIIETATLIATFLPQDGAKLASLRVKKSGKELLIVRDTKTYKTLDYIGEYCDAECSGFDDMFPTIDAFEFAEGPYQGLQYPDHGEACRLAYHVSQKDEKIVFTANSKIFPIQYQKEVWATEDGKVNVRYIYRNKGRHPFPFLWAAHMMLQWEDGAKIFTPYSSDAVPELMFASEEVVEETLPVDRLSGYEPGIGLVYKYYYMEPMPSGTFGVIYPDDCKLTLEVDAKKIPYFGIWFNNGKFQDLYTVALEPCSIPLDAVDRAKKRGYESIIPAESEFVFEMGISWEE